MQKIGDSKYLKDMHDLANRLRGNPEGMAVTRRALDAETQADKSKFELKTSKKFKKKGQKYSKDYILVKWKGCDVMWPKDVKLGYLAYNIKVELVETTVDGIKLLELVTTDKMITRQPTEKDADQQEFDDILEGKE